MQGTLRWLVALAVTVVAVLAVAPSALAGRLIQTGHDIDFHCAAQSEECNFVKVAVNYVRGGAPNPSKPVLVLDRLDLDVKQAIDKAFGANRVPMTVVDPRSPAFATMAIDTARFSAIFVASDVTCTGCDLNNPPSGGTTASTPDSTAIAARTASIAAFFDAGGGIVAGAGGDNSGGAPGIAFSTTNVPYYTFIATSGAGGVNGPFQLTPLGVALGITNADINFLGGCTGCIHNSFGPPPAGSQLIPIERDPTSGRFITLIQDSDPPRAIVMTGPPSTTTATSASFAFRSTEDRSRFQCQLDGGAFASCGTQRTFTGLAEGRHTVNVRAIDLVGNVQPTPTAYSWRVCLDRDGDGFTSCSRRPDCNDTRRSVNPRAREVTGNRVDENCDDFSAPFNEIEASVRYVFSSTSSSTTVDLINLAGITRRAKLRVSCKGGGCPFKAKRVRIKRRRARLAGLFRGAALRPGATITAAVTRRRWISKVYRFRIKSAALPSLATLCQVPGRKGLKTRCPVFTR